MITLPDYPSVVINIGSIKVTTIENTSSLNIGRNYLREFRSENKTNQGLGTILGGTNSFPYNTNLVDDPDVLDMHCGSGLKQLGREIEELLPAAGNCRRQHIP
ncbi:MAG: spore germination protein [Peptococcaceae bacterium]|nr:spore germination protein [Peptococcaceae bacterium]